MSKYRPGYVVNMHDRAGVACVSYATDEDHISAVIDIIVDSLKALTFGEELIARGLQQKVDEMLESRS